MHEFAEELQSCELRDLIVTTVHINPQGVDDEYLECLNLCFGNWGDRRIFDWYFRRKTGFPDPDLIVLKKNGQIMAGSAVTYRRVALLNGNEIGVGIMTGSWTLPHFRGRGCFTRMVKESLHLTAQKDGSLLLAFVTEDNASLRQLTKAGAALFGSSYIFSTPRTVRHKVACQLTSVAKGEAAIKSMFKQLSKGGKGYCRFSYSSERDLAAQFIHRPGDELPHKKSTRNGIVASN